MVKQPDTDFPLKGFELYRLEGYGQQRNTVRDGSETILNWKLWEALMQRSCYKSETLPSW